jgi:hypothetical protein
MVIAHTVYAGDSGKQILLNNKIEKTDAFGKWNNTDYTTFYNVRNLFDNQTNSWSFWGQYGKSGFSVDFVPLKYPVCSVEMQVFNPKNTPFKFQIASNETIATLDGDLNNQLEIIQLDKCLSNANTMQLTSDAPGNWTILSEVKLFSNVTTNPGPVEPPVCPPGMHYDDVLKKCVSNTPEPEPEPEYNITKLNIANSTVYANMTDSSLIVNLNDDSQIVENITEIEEPEEEEDEK